jgi:hypothetical protein
VIECGRLYMCRVCMRLLGGDATCRADRGVKRGGCNLPHRDCGIRSCRPECGRPRRSTWVEPRPA